VEYILKAQGKLESVVNGYLAERSSDSATRSTI